MSFREFNSDFMDLKSPTTLAKKVHRNFGTNFASTTPLILQHFTIRFGHGKGYIQEMRNNVFFGQFPAWNDETLESNHHVVQYDPFFQKWFVYLKSMKAFTFQLVLCVVEVACLKIIGRITQRLNAKNVEESDCGSDKRHEKIEDVFLGGKIHRFFLCLLFVEWVKPRWCGHLEKVVQGGSAKGILQKGLEFNF